MQMIDEAAFYKGLLEASFKHYKFTEGMLGADMFYEINMSRPPSGAELACLIQKLKLDLCMIELSEGRQPSDPGTLTDAVAVDPIEENHEEFVSRMMKENAAIK